jgi:hypothetical protein
MKLKKVSQKDVSAGVPTLIGAGAGFMVARGVSGSVVNSTAGIPLTDDQKKKKLYVALACLAIGGYGLMAVDGNDSVSVGVKGVAIGTALNGLSDVVAHLADKAPAKPDTTTATGKFLANALGCPCETAPMPMNAYAPLARPRSLRMPEVNQYQPKLVDLGNFATPVRDLAQLAS